MDLGDGTQWRLGADERTEPWLDEFARIFQLNKVLDKEVVDLTSPFFLFTEMSTHAAWMKTYYPDSSKQECRNRWKLWPGQSVKLWFHEKRPDAVCEIAWKNIEKPRYANMWDALHPIYKKSVIHGGLPFHAGLVEFEGKAFILSGPGDTGKSTCCRRIQAPWKPLCDDEVLVVLDSLGFYQAHPFPTWSDYMVRNTPNTWDVQYSIPLGGIFFLEQSESDEIIPLNQSETAVLINKSATQVWRKFLFKTDETLKRDISLQLFNNACQMAKQTPGFLLRNSLNGRFWEKMEKVI